MKTNTNLPEIFAAVIATEDEKQRKKLVQQMIETQPELRERLDQLLGLDRADVRDDNPRAKIGKSIVNSLQPEFTISPVVLKNDSFADDEPVIKPSSPEVPNRKKADKFQVQGEIARGGMGAILKGRDVDLGRSLAMKVLLDEHKENPLMVQRFIEEAQIGGQLQHPGVAPVYELGQFEDQRPFFTMKLVKGRTLAAMLSARTNVFDRGKLLGIFEQICQTMAYAHNRGVIHRDLKPANIMVGSFGEVQVMDWGLAKVLESGGTADEKIARRNHIAHSVIQTFRSDGSGPAMIGTDPANAGETLAGSVMGTPAYMPPEQARGEVERLDERCDVFGLGAILCEILVGHPPYFDDNPREVLHLARKGNTEPAFKRLDECRADPELVAIAKECLASEPTERIRDAQVLAEKVSGYLEGVESKLHETEIAREKEATRAVEAKKRQRVTLALAASILLTLGLGAAAWLWNQNQFNQRQLAATEKVNEAFGEAKIQMGLASSADLNSKVHELEKTLAIANTANELAQNKAVENSLKSRVEEYLVEVKQILEQTKNQVRLADADERLKEKLEFIRLSHADGKKTIETKPTALSRNFDTIETREKYQRAFRESGHDVTQQSESEIVDWIRSSEIRETLISAIDHWSQCLPSPQHMETLSPWTLAKSWEEAVQIAKREMDQNPSSSLHWMQYGATLAKSGNKDAYQKFCQEMLDRFGKETSIMHQERVCKMCTFLPDVVDIEELPTNWETIVETNVLPSSNFWLAWAWHARALKALRQGDFETAISFADKSDQLNPKEICKVLNHCVRAIAAKRVGKTKLAHSSLLEADRSFRESVEKSTQYHHDYIFARILIGEAESLIQPEKRLANFPLDDFPRSKSKATEATIRSTLGGKSLNDKLFRIVNQVDSSELRKQVRSALFDNDVELLRQTANDSKIKQQQPEVLTALAVALREADESSLAEKLLRDGQRSNPGDFWLNYELSRCLIDQNKYEEGLGFSRSALAVRPNSVGAMWLMTAALIDANRNDEAMEQFKQLIANSELSDEGYHSLASSMQDYGQWEAAELAILKAIELAPKKVLYLANHATILETLGRDSDAIEVIESAIKIKPHGLIINIARAQLLWKLGKEEEAIKQVRRVIKMHPKLPIPHGLLGSYLGQTGDLEGALESYKQAVSLAPQNKSFRYNLSVTYSKLEMFGEAIEHRAEYRQRYADEEKLRRDAVKNDPRSAAAHYRLGYNLYMQRRFKEAAESFKESLKIDDKVATRFYTYGYALWNSGEKEEAIVQWKRCIELNDELAKYHERVGWALKQLDKNDEAIPYYEKAVELNPEHDHAKWQLVDLLASVGREDESAAIAETLPERKPKRPIELLQIAGQQATKGDLKSAEKTLRDALALQPKQAFGYQNALADVLAKQGKVDESLELLDSVAEPKHHTLHSARAHILAFYKGDYKQAEAEFRKALQSNSRFARIGLVGLLVLQERFQEAEELINEDKDRVQAFPLLHVGQIYCQFAKGENEPALAAIEKFVDDHPKLSIGYINWADMLIFEADENGKYSDAAKAVELATKACEIQVNNMSNLVTLGTAQYRDGQTRAAIVSLEKARTLGFHNPTCWLYLAMAYAENGDADKAQEYLDLSNEWIANSTSSIQLLQRLLSETKSKLKNK